MTLLIAEHAAEDHVQTPDSRVRLLPVGDRLWRVIDSAGRALGHLQSRGDGRLRRFAARRFHAPSGGFRDIGEFWTAREAVECLRLSR